MFCSDVKADNRSAELMSNDMHKEMLRQKWEEEELAAMNQPIHYANVQYDGKMEVDSAVYLFSKHFLFCISWISYCNSLNWSTFYFYRYVFNSFTQQSNISFIQVLTSSLLELHQRKQICVHAFHLPRTERNNGALVDLIHINFFEWYRNKDPWCRILSVCQRWRVKERTTGYFERYQRQGEVC